MWWTFKVFEHGGVSVLDGGFPAWKKAGGQIEDTPPKEFAPAKYPVPRGNEELVRTFKQMTELAKKGDKSVQIIDARSNGRYTFQRDMLFVDLLEPILSHEKVAALQLYRSNLQACPQDTSRDLSQCPFSCSLNPQQVNSTIHRR